MVLHKAKTQLTLMQKLRAYLPNRLKAEVREATDIVFSVMVIFMLTCVGSMLLICFFFEMERRSPTPQPTAPQPTTQQRLPFTLSAPVK